MGKPGAVISIIIIIAASLLLAWHLFTPPGPKILQNRDAIWVHLIAPLCFLAIICNPLFFKLLAISAQAWPGWLIWGGCGAALLAAPFFLPPAWELPWRMGALLSLAWFAGAFALGTALFILGVRLNNNISAVFCGLGVICLIFATFEAWRMDAAGGLRVDAANSEYFKNGQAQNFLPTRQTAGGYFPIRPEHPSASFGHRELLYDAPLFDVKYTFDEAGHRIGPPKSAQAENALMVFGCSYTFGHGLENEAAWPWLLAEDLGPTWSVDNYSFMGFGIQHMLYLLEEGDVAKPGAKSRHALFLAIANHLRRSAGLYPDISLRYKLEDGKLTRAGFTNESPYSWLVFLPSRINGSKAAQWFSDYAQSCIFNKSSARFRGVFIAIAKRAAEILREKYNAPLTILLWPDIEELGPELEAAGIPALYARDYLDAANLHAKKDWEIFSPYEDHPNARAARALADGLAGYYRKLAPE